MVQQLLIDSDTLSVKTVSLDGIKAIFTELIEGMYEVVLEINSQKFLLRIGNDLECVDHFEVIATKGFVYDLTKSMILLLKSLVESLQTRLN